MDLSPKDMVFIFQFGKFVQENILVPVPIFITSPFLINKLNEVHAKELIDAVNNNSIEIESDDLSIPRIKYLIKYTVGFELSKRKWLMLFQCFLQLLAFILLFVLW